MNIELTPELEHFVQCKMQTGQYRTQSEVVSKALYIMEKRDLVKDEIREKIAAGIESLRQGKGIDGEAFFAELEAEDNEEPSSKSHNVKLELANSR